MKTTKTTITQVLPSTKAHSQYDTKTVETTETTAGSTPTKPQTYFGTDGPGVRGWGNSGGTEQTSSFRKLSEQAQKLNEIRQNLAGYIYRGYTGLDLCFDEISDEEQAKWLDAADNVLFNLTDIFE